MGKANRGGLIVSPIPTEYNGDLFRSRLEARWAVYFTHLGLEYIYELEGFKLPDSTKYLPDFWFPMFQCWAEVKPRILDPHEFHKCVQLPEGCLILDSPRPEPDCIRGYYYTGDPLNHKVTYEAYKADENWYRVLLAKSHYKGRLWFLFGETPGDYGVELHSREINAIRKARQARFEHGERPSIPVRTL